MKFILATTNKNKLSEINDIAKEYGIEFELPQTPIEVDEDGETLYENALKKAETLVELQRQGQGNALKKAETLVELQRQDQGNALKKAETWVELQRQDQANALKKAEFLVGRSRANASEPVTGNNPLEWKAGPETECKDYAEPNNSVRLVELQRQGQEKNLLPKQQENFYVLSDDTGLFVEALGGAPGIHSARYDTTSEKRIEKLLNALKDKTNRNAKFLCTMVLLSSNGEILITNTGEIKGSITNTLKGVNGFGYDPIFFIDHLNKTMAQLTKEEKNTVSHRAKALIPILEFIKTSIL